MDQDYTGTTCHFSQMPLDHFLSTSYDSGADMTASGHISPEIGNSVRNGQTFIHLLKP